MSKLVQKIKYFYNGVNVGMYVYGKGSMRSNFDMQEPLEKLYKYENEPNIKDEIWKYINEFKRIVKDYEENREEYMKKEGYDVVKIDCLIVAYEEVIYDLEAKLKKISNED